MKCDKCRSTKLISWGSRVVKGGKRVKRYQCTKCGHVGDKR